ncbi:MAG: hypothetical protein MR361_05770 [Clostridiales bacterium]|nr:hypothetical protein [Clostridiales bacterium]MDD6293238.1 hypothetical protein [Eubacteriales bacterium]
MTNQNNKEYPKGYVYELMDKGGPTDCRQPYFKEASEEMMRQRLWIKC